MIRRSIRSSILCSLVMLAAACGTSEPSTANVASTPLPAPTTPVPTSTTTTQPVPTDTATSTPPSAEATVAPNLTTETGDSDLPALSAENAPPTPAATTAEPSHASEPARIIIPDIGLDLPTVSVGLDAQQIPIVPKHDVGWFTGSSMPGDRSNVILWGHVLRWLDSPSIEAPFTRMHELAPGAEITIITVDGQEHRYRVTQQIQARPEETQLLYPTLSERLTLVSCIGDKVIQEGTLTKEFRLVTIAEPEPLVVGSS